MPKIVKPKWLLFAEECRSHDKLHPPTGKDFKRLKQSHYSDWLTATREHGYEGTADDWFYLMGWRGNRAP